ncbi:CotO family spore coat protein [Bacillus bingmayongensis]|uniref:CotO family spore coat protein n=1 Tax=Bacillus bingmayongensis TaxID=1150157 RepID=UPI0002F9155B|nr:CotO family spore coat protein [Bacillus bingmayongensis]
MAKKKSGQKKNVPSLYMRSIDAEALEKYTQRTFVIKKDTFTKENHMAQQTSQEIWTDEKNVAKSKEQAEEKETDVVEYREQQKEADVAKSKEQAEEKEADVVEYREQQKEADVVKYKEQAGEKEADVVEYREQQKEADVVEYKEQTEAKEADVVEYKEQAEGNEEGVVESEEQPEEKEVVKYKEQTEEKEAGVVESEEQAKEKEADVVESEEQPEKNIAEQAEEVQEGVVSKNKEREKSGAEVQNNKHKFISFREMTNEEKVYYLLNRPHYIPKANCFFRTKRASYIGRIIAYENGRVKIKSSTKLIETVIDINEIILIQMIGT